MYKNCCQNVIYFIKTDNILTDPNKAKKVNIPLVLHASSGIEEDAFKKYIELGISKINLCTNLIIAAAKGVKNIPETTDNYGEINLVAEESIKTSLIN